MDKRYVSMMVVLALLVINFNVIMARSDGGWLEKTDENVSDTIVNSNLIDLPFNGSKRVGLIHGSVEIINNTHRYIALVDDTGQLHLYNDTEEVSVQDINGYVSFVNAIENDTRYIFVVNDTYIYILHLNGTIHNITSSLPLTETTIIYGLKFVKDTISVYGNVYRVIMLYRDYSASSDTYYYNITMYLINADNYGLIRVFDGCVSEHTTSIPNNLFIYKVDAFYNETDDKIFFSYGNYFYDEGTGNKNFNFTLSEYSLRTYTARKIVSNVLIGNSLNDIDTYHLIDIGFLNNSDDSNTTLYGSLLVNATPILIVTYEWNWTDLSVVYNTNPVDPVTVMVTHNATAKVSKYIQADMSSNIYIIELLDGRKTSLMLDPTIYKVDDFNSNIIIGNYSYYMKVSNSWKYRCISNITDIGIEALGTYYYGENITLPSDGTWITGYTNIYNGSAYIYPDLSGAYLVYAIYGDTWLPFIAVVNASDTPYIDSVTEISSITNNVLYNGVGRLNNSSYFYLYYSTSGISKLYCNFGNGTVIKYNLYNDQSPLYAYMIAYNDTSFIIVENILVNSFSENHIVVYDFNKPNYTTELNITEVVDSANNLLIDVYYTESGSYLLYNDYSIYFFNITEGIEFRGKLDINATNKLIAWNIENNTVSSNLTGVYINNSTAIQNYIYDITGIYGDNFYYFNYTDTSRPLETLVYHIGDKTINVSAPYYITGISGTQKHRNTTPLHIYDRTYYITTYALHYVTLIDSNDLPLVIPEIPLYMTPIGMNYITGIAQISNDTMIVITGNKVYEIVFNLSAYIERTLLVNIEIELESGWNFISIPTDGISVSTLFSEYMNLTPVIITIERNSTMNVFTPYYCSLNYTDYTIQNASPFFIYAKQSLILHLEIKLLYSIEYTMYKGWNTIGLPYNKTYKASDFCEETGAMITVNRDYEPYLYDVSPNDYEMTSFNGYFVYYNETSTFLI